MRFLRKLGLVASAIGLQTLAALAAPADDTASGRRPQDDRWVPGASIFSMGLPEGRSAKSTEDGGEFQAGQTVGFPWTVGAGLELASPVLLDVPGRPRLYAHGDVAYAYDTEDPVLSDGDPGDRPVPTGTPPVVAAIENTGVAVRAEAKPLVLSGGFGAVFEFERWDRSFRIRPSLEWIYRRDEFRGIVGRGELENEGPDPGECAPCRILFFEAETEKGYHSLGPGLEIEADAGRFRDLLMSFYVSGRAYRILGDRKAVLVANGAWETTEDPPQPSTRPDTAFRGEYERDPWHYRFGVGFRFMWMPE